MATNLTGRGPNATTRAKLPALTAPRLDDPQVQRALDSIREWLEVRLGARGDYYERAVTFRDLEQQLDALRTSLASTSTSSTASTDLSSVVALIAQLRADMDQADATLTSAINILSNRVGSGGTGTVDLTTVNQWLANQSVLTVSLTDAATISVDASLGNVFRVTLGGDRTLANPTNLTDGMVLDFIIVQDATGGRILGFGSKYWFSGDRAVSSTLNSVSLVRAVYDGASDRLLCTMHTTFAAVIVPLLLHFNGTNGSTTFTDSSSYGPRSITATGSAALTTAQYKFATASLDLNGSSCAVVPYTSDLQITGDFTLEGFGRRTNDTLAWRGMFNLSNSTSTGGVHVINTSDRKLSYYHSGASILKHQTDTPLNTWFHVALVRQSGEFWLYLDGVKSSTSLANTTVFSSGLIVGASNTSGSEGMIGQIDEVRLTIGQAVYTATFTPPTVEFT